MKYYFLLTAVLFSMCFQAQTYEGTIGEYPIFLELDIDYEDDRATAFYFYGSQLENIPLEGNHTSSELILFEKYTDKEDQKELFSLNIIQDKLTGTWKNNGRTLNVDLTKSEGSIDEYKLKNLKFIRDSITGYNSKELVWFTEKHSKNILFRLGNGFTSSEREFMNSKLDSIHIQNATIGLDCESADMNIEIEFVSDQYISFSEYSSIYCGGAHPNHNTRGYNFDYKNKIQLDKITDVYPHINLFNVLKKKYENDTDLQAECEYFTSGEALWDYYSWVFTKSGVSITPSFPHAMTPCETSFPLTYKELQQTN